MTLNQVTKLLDLGYQLNRGGPTVWKGTVDYIYKHGDRPPTYWPNLESIFGSSAIQKPYLDKTTPTQ